MLGGLRLVLTTGSMNRLEPLRRALSTWLSLSEIDRFIIVDWGSSPPLSQALRDFSDPRILIVRTLDQKHWHNSKCHNLELRLASRADFLLRVDNDTLVSRDFFKHHPYRRGGFYAVNWRTVPREVDDKRNLAGTLLIPPRDLLKVNGYNERLVHYGREDDDLHARLLIEGYRWHEIALATVEHIPHTDKARIENLATDPCSLKTTAELLQAKLWGNKPSHLSVLIAESERIIAESPWTKNDTMTRWDTRQVDAHYWECKEARVCNE